MNLNFGLDMKSLDSMARASGKNYYKQYRAAVAYQQRKPKPNRNPSPMRLEAEPYHYDQEVTRIPVKEAAAQRESVPNQYYEGSNAGLSS